MPDFFYRTVGEAYAAMVQFLQDSVLNPPAIVEYAGGGWAPKVGAVPGYFEIITRTPTVVWNWYAKESLSSPGLPFGYVVREPGLQSAIICTYPVGGTIGATFESVNQDRQFAKLHCIQDVCGAGGAFLGQDTVTFTGMSNAGLVVSFAKATIDDDAIWWNCNDVNLAYAVVNYPPTLPQQPVMPSGQYLTPGSFGSVIKVDSPLDQDISLNGQQAIVSLISKTVTMIP